MTTCMFIIFSSYDISRTLQVITPTLTKVLQDRYCPIFTYRTIEAQSVSMVCMRSVSWVNGKSVCFQRLGCISSLALYQNLFLGLFPKNTGILQIDEHATSWIPLNSPEGWLLTQTASLYTSSYGDKEGARVWSRTGRVPKGGDVLVRQTHTCPLYLPMWGEVVFKLGAGFI